MKHNKMKWIVYVLLFSFLLASFAACGSDTSDGVETDPVTEGADGTSAEEPTGGSEEPTTGATEDPTEGPTEEPEPKPEPLLYNGTPDTSWYDPNHVKNEYVLKTAEEFMGFFTLRSGSMTFEGKTIRLDADIIINPGTVEEILARKKAGETVYDWIQMNSAWVFKGTFDGQGHTVSGVYLQCEKSGDRSMFGTISGVGCIKNLNVSHLYVGGPSVADNTLGGLVSRVSEKSSNIAFANVHISDALICQGETATERLGGFVGQIGDLCYVSFSNCSFEGTIDTAGRYAGGFVGFMDGGSANVDFYNCSVNASVTAMQYAGGLAGYANGKAVMDEGNTVQVTLNCGNDGGEKFGYVNETYSQSFAPMAEPAEGTNSLRVMSFNLQGNLGGDNNTPSAEGRDRIEAVVAEILANQPSVIGLQEDKAAWVSNLSTRLTDYNVYCDFILNDSTERDAILYRKDLKLIDRGYCWLTADGTGNTVGLTIKDLTTEGSPYYMTEDELSKLFLSKDSDDSELKASQTKYYDKNTGALCTGSVGSYLTTRRMTYIVLDMNGQAVIYANTHLTHRAPNNPWYNTWYAKLRSLERIREFDILNEQIAKVKEKYPNALVVITGDYNDLPGQPIYNHVSEMYTDSSLVAEVSVGPYGTWNNAFNLTLQGANFPSVNEDNTTGKLDYCFISKEGFTVTRYKNGNGRGTFTRADGTRKTVYTSDHLPIIIDLNFAVPGGSLGDPIKDPEPGDGSTSYYNGIPDMSWYTGDQTEYVLTTAAQLYGFMALRSEELNFDGITIKLGCDMIINDMTSEQLKASGGKNVFIWRELGSTVAFKGTLDGQGHKISGIYFKASAGLRGLLGTADGTCTVKDLTLENVYLVGPDKTGKSVMGTLFGRVNATAKLTVSGVTIDAIVENGQKGSDFYIVGGFIGDVKNGATITMENCTFKGSISIESDYAAGLVAYCGSDRIVLTNCHNYGTIKSRDYANALIGYCQYSSTKVDLTDCSNQGTIHSEGTHSGELYYKVK